MTVHSNVFETFVTIKGDVVYSMKQCDHGLHIHTPNPYHMEGDVWTHTVLAYNSLLLNKEFNELSDYHKKLVCIAVLCHDLGKPYTKEIKYNGHCRFFGHEKRSVAEMVNLVDFLSTYYKLDAYEMYAIMLIVSAHSEYWHSNNMQSVYPLLNYDEALLKLYKVVVTADYTGQLRSSTLPKSEDSKSYIYEFDFDLTRPEFASDDLPEIVLAMGTPACGKDTVIRNYGPDYDVISYDDIRIDVWRTAYGIDQTMTATDEYSNAWFHCKNMDLMNMLVDKVQQSIEAGHNVAIANTNMTVKSRAALIKNIKARLTVGVRFTVIWPFTDIIDCINRDNFRGSNDKTVGSDVIHRMFYNLELPTLAEDIDNIYPVYNAEGADIEFV